MRIGGRARRTQSAHVVGGGGPGTGVGQTQTLGLASRDLMVHADRW